MDYLSSYAYTRIPSDDSEEDEQLERVDSTKGHVDSVDSDSTKGYVYSPECKVYHKTKGHYNANLPITNTTGYTQCTRCRVTNERPVPLRLVYISSRAARVYHDTKGHYNANIPTVGTIGRVHCSRCRLPDGGTPAEPAHAKKKTQDH